MTSHDALDENASELDALHRHNVALAFLNNLPEWTELVNEALRVTELTDVNQTLFGHGNGMTLFVRFAAVFASNARNKIILFRKMEKTPVLPIITPLISVGYVRPV